MSVFGSLVLLLLEGLGVNQFNIKQSSAPLPSEPRHPHSDFEKLTIFMPEVVCMLDPLVLTPLWRAGPAQGTATILKSLKAGLRHHGKMMGYR